jgi:hypothetical protein
MHEHKHTVLGCLGPSWAIFAHFWAVFLICGPTPTSDGAGDGPSLMGLRLVMVLGLGLVPEGLRCSNVAQV